MSVDKNGSLDCVSVYATTSVFFILNDNYAVKKTPIFVGEKKLSIA